jgi:hypothetical protein
MSLESVSPGDPIPREAATYNAMFAAARAHRAELNRLSGAGLSEHVPPGVVLVRNDTGSALDRGAVVGLGDVLITPTHNLAEFRAQPIFAGETPDADTHVDKWAILYEPLRKSAAGWAVCAGVHAAQVSFATENEMYANLAAGATTLKGAGGGARVLYKESGTGTKWAALLLGAPCYPVVPATLGADLDSGSSATATLLTGTSRATSGDSITVYDTPTAISASKKIASGVGVRTYYDPVVGEYVLAVPFDCEEDQ